eukprot:gb/GECH01005840.1/.p1 GENE.gb/GECH01005840.1/~~gb/GECH01005840.1/.p1  ORF type:complete len:465 (+),score=77.09 gb/GECH01005840.1/:1-1395(+)
MSHSVTLYLYDLTRGMAAMYSSMFLGKHIDAIWHSSIVVHGKEYFFGMGVQCAAPGTTPHGQPTRTVDMGTTDIDADTVYEYAQGLGKERFAPGTYHLLDHNCNTFTHDMALFLTGRGIPEYVRDLPADVLDSPLGPTIRSFVDSFMNPTGSTSIASPSSLSQNTKPNTPVTVPRIRFTAGNVTAIVKKLHELHGDRITDAQRQDIDAVQASLITAKNTESNDTGPVTMTENQLRSLLAVLTAVPEEKSAFPVLDLLRLCAAHPQPANLLSHSIAVLDVPSPVASLANDITGLSRPSHLLVLRLAANLSYHHQKHDHRTDNKTHSSSSSSAFYITKNAERLERAVLWATQSLEAEMEGIRYAAAALAANLAVCVGGEDGSHDAESDPYVLLATGLAQRLADDGEAPRVVEVCVAGLWHLVGETGVHVELARELIADPAHLTSRLPTSSAYASAAARLAVVLGRS